MSSIPEKEINIIELISGWSNKTTIINNSFLLQLLIITTFSFDAKTTYKYEVNFTNIAYDKYGLINQNIFVANKLIADQQGLLETDTMIINEAKFYKYLWTAYCRHQIRGCQKLKSVKMF